MSEITYGQLDGILRSLGFTSFDAPIQPPTRMYEHKPSGAEVFLPILPSDQRVYLHHLATTKMALEDFGVLSQDEFEARLRKAG